MIFNLLSGTAEEHQCHGEPRRRTVLTNTLKNKNENPFCIWAKKKFIFEKYILQIVICAMENVAGTCMVAAGAMQYWSGVARAASLQATSSQHPSKVSPDRGLHPAVAELLVMSRKFCGISFGFRTESSGVWRCAGYRAAVWWLRSSDGRRSRRTRPDSRHCEVSPPLTLSPSRTADNPTDCGCLNTQQGPFLPCKVVGVKEFSGPWTEAQACWGKFYIFALGSDGYSEWLLRASEGNQEIPSRVWKIWFSQRQIWSDEATKSDQLK